VPSDPAAIPEPSDYVVRAIADWLQSQEPSQRVPVKTATVLALVCLLYRDKRSFPTRPAIAKQLGLTEAIIDLTISQRTATGLLQLVTKTEMGRVKKRPSVITVRYIEPSLELMGVSIKAEKAEKKELALMSWRRKAVPMIITIGGLIHFCPHCWGMLLELACLENLI